MAVEEVYYDIARGMKDSELEYLPRLLAKMFTLEEANIVRELPAPPEDIARELGLDAEHVKKTCKKLVREGKILQTDRGPRPFNYGSQFGDILLADPAQDETRDDEFWLLLTNYLTSPERMANERRYLTRDIQIDGQPINRVVPQWKAIEGIPGVMPCEDMREILNAYSDRLNTTRCICRTATKQGIRLWGLEDHCPIPEGAGTLPEEGNCIHLGQMAEYFTEAMELTPYRSTEGILEHLAKLEDKAHYQMGPNDRNIKFICTCCDCCCGVANAIKNSPDHDLSDMLAKSRFLSIVDAGECTGCEDCLAICPFHAIEMQDGKARIDAEKCYGCGICVLNCPAEALQMKIVRPPEHIPENGAQLVDVEILEVRELT